MGRKIAVPWHLLFSLVAGALYFYFVLPRWHELTGDTPHALGTALRIATGALIGLAALPVVFTLLRTRKPELGAPQLSLSLLTWSIVAHVLAGVLIIGAAISEIWLSLDAAGQYLFGIYGAAAAIAVLGFVAFYLSFIAELPPPPPKPIKAKKPKQRRIRRGKKRDAAEEAEEAADEAEADTAEADEPDEKTLGPAEETVEAAAEIPASPESPSSRAPETEPESATEETRAGLRNRRPTGKASHRLRRRGTQGTVALDE